MKIKLQGIGIIKDSEIELNGLTVITGDNNSGKTTVGKVVYSLIDAVSNLSRKAEMDKNIYVRENLQTIVKELDFLSVCFTPSAESKTGEFDLEYLFRNPRHINSKNAVSMANKLYDRLRELREKNFDILDKDTYKMLLEAAAMKLRKIDTDDVIVKYYVDLMLDMSLEALKNLLANLKNDPLLIDYARGSIYRTLYTEFMGQIQPVETNVDKSSIVVKDSNETYFQFDIVDNKIVNDGEPIYIASPIKRAFFVDNPFVLDSGDDFIHKVEFNDANNENILNKGRIYHHEDKLRNFIKRTTTNLFESNILERQFGEINAKLSEVISGNFEFSRDGDYYVDKGKKLRFSNLATGSKLFSILKLLINKGAISDSTLLVLDEPEAHLHPAWQNKFAEIIVMLVKELHVTVLLTSHSSNFVLAVDAYMRKYEINDKTNFYQTQFLDNGFVEYVNVNDDIGEIYSDFAQYLTEVKLIRNKYLNGLGEKNDKE